MKKLLTIVLLIAMIASMSSIASAGVYDPATGENTSGHVSIAITDAVPSADFDMSSVYGVTVQFENDTADAGYQNGQFVFSGYSGAWNQFSFGPEGEVDYQGNPYTVYWQDNGDGTFSFTYLSDAPVFAEGDTTPEACSFLVGDWNDYQITVKSVKLLDVNGKDVNAVVDDGGSVEDGGASDDSAQTGDMMNVALLAGVAALAFVAVVASKKANA